MSSFEDTSNWKKKDGTTLVYSKHVDGREVEGTCEKEPNSLFLRLERLSVAKETSWKPEDGPSSEFNFATREYLEALGYFENCCIHAITLDSSENKKITRVSVSIFPIELKELQETAKDYSLSEMRKIENKPDEGWMSGENGRLRYYEEGGHSSLYATLFLSSDKLEDLAKDIKSGNITSAQLEIIADLYSLGAFYEDYFNYAILCNNEEDRWGGKNVSGHTKARLERVHLRWSSQLEVNRAQDRDGHDDDY